jgi:hypothetical protein
MMARILTALVLGGVLAVSIPASVRAQETVPPLQPPYPTAPPPMRWPMAVMARGIGYEARTHTEDAVAALTARGFFPVPVPHELFNPAEACLRRDASDYACTQAALTGVAYAHMDPVSLVLVEARLEGEILSWTCIGPQRLVTVSFALGDFFTPDIAARQTARNRALACIERSLGFDRDREHSTL